MRILPQKTTSFAYNIKKTTHLITAVIIRKTKYSHFFTQKYRSSANTI